ncbi:MAG: dTDP-4-dehydrorhamnose reductase [Pseudonocardiales bacterium]|nr:dTDP-4-dehydrorhamnose reductase [Pseudonocardiales bacterium]
MRVTIFGATGMLGKALMRQWTGDDVTGLGSAQVDIRDPEQVQRAIQQTRPEWIVLSAAYTDVDGCEINPTLASAVNTHGATNVAKAAASAGSKLLFVSTDYVFDGRNTSPYETSERRNPINIYGKTKAEAEERIIAILPDCCIVRTSWLFGPGGKCFPDTILKLAASRPELEVVNDQRGSPTYTLDLSDAIIQLCRAGAQGIVHCTNSGNCSWYDFASEILREAGLKTVVRPTTSEKFVRPAERPKYSVLSSASLSRYQIQMRPWQRTLADYLGQRGSMS